MRRLMIGLAAVTLVTAAPAAAQTAFEPQLETPESLPDHPGRDETFSQCAACHAMALVRRQGLSRDGWDGILRLMVERHGMQELPADERQVILNYLATAFPPRAQPQGGWRNPFAQ